MCKYTVCFYEVSLNVPISQVVNKSFQQVYNSKEFFLNGSGIGEWGVRVPTLKKLEECSLLGLLVKDLTELSHRLKKRFNDLDNDH